MQLLFPLLFSFHDTVAIQTPDPKTKLLLFQRKGNSLSLQIAGRIKSMYFQHSCNFFPQFSTHLSTFWIPVNIATQREVNSSKVLLTYPCTPKYSLDVFNY